VEELQARIRELEAQLAVTAERDEGGDEDEGEEAVAGEGEGAPAAAPGTLTTATPARGTPAKVVSRKPAGVAGGASPASSPVGATAGAAAYVLR
jgi:hypothetical protein